MQDKVIRRFAAQTEHSVQLLLNDRAIRECRRVLPGSFAVEYKRP